MEKNQQPQPAQTDTSAQQTPTQPTKIIPSTSKTKYILVGLIVLLVLLILGGGAYYLGLVKKHSSPQKNGNLKNPTASVFTTTNSKAPIPLPNDKDPVKGDYAIYTNPDLTFYYPPYWGNNGNSVEEDGTNMADKIIVGSSDSPLSDKCLQKTSTESKDNLIIQYFSTTNAGEECSGNDINNRQIWILKDNNTYYPGISFSYPIKDEARAKTLFQEILNTFKFTNPPSEELSTFSNNYLNFKYSSEYATESARINGSDSFAIFPWSNTWANLASIGIINPNNASFIGECDKITSTEYTNGVFVEFLSNNDTTKGQLCAGNGNANEYEKTIIILPNSKSQSPGIYFSYDSLNNTEAIKVFNQILPSVKFLSK